MLFCETSSYAELRLLVILGVLSDLFDGIIARKLNVATSKLRKLDSNADIVFSVGVLITLFIINDDLKFYLYHVILLLSLEVITYFFYWLKFKKQPSNHSYLTKMFGASILLNFCMIIGWNNFVFFDVLMLFGILSYLDGFAILLRLKDWKVDNKSVFHIKK
ncbi:MAG: CDP-alcohol phosphatidyltransferase family protein [Vicingaceae bacterium]